jgi:hypothetical protein
MFTGTVNFIKRGARQPKNGLGGGVEVHSGSQNKKYSTVSAIKKATPQKNFLSYSQHLDGL